MENDMICDKCGRKLLSEIKGHTLTIYCPDHGIVTCTSYFPEIETDSTNYVIFLNPNNECSIDNIKLISKILNNNFMQANQTLLTNEPIELYQAKNYTGCVGSKAEKVLEIASLLKKNNISFYIVPEFKYDIL